MRTDPDSISLSLERVALVAMDVEGTLTHSDNSVGVATAEAIAQAVANGVHIVLVSEEGPREVRQLHKSLGLTTPVIVCGGAMIVDFGHNAIIHHQPLPGADAAIAVREARAAGGTGGPVVVGIQVGDRYITERCDSHRSTAPGASPLDLLLSHPVTKVHVEGAVALLGHLMGRLSEEYKGKFGFIPGRPGLLQVVHPDVDKGRALEWVAARLGVPRGRVLAIGNDSPDVPMLRWAATSVAVGNASPDAKSTASLLVESNDHDGVATALQRYVLR